MVEIFLRVWLLLTKNRMVKDWSQRGYESTVIASRYVDFRPKPPQQLTDRIVEFLKEKV